MKRPKNEFQTIRSEGGLLPADLLRRVVAPQENLPGTKREDYGLPRGERINEAITQSWNRMRRHWSEFRIAASNLPDNEPGTGLTNDKWTVPLLRELGFGLLPTSLGPEINGRTYAINRFFGPTAVHLVGCGVSLDRRAAGVRGAAVINPHGLVQEFLNRSQGHLWAIVSNGLRFRILRDNQALSRQSYLEFDLEAMFAGEVFSDFVLLWLMAHATRFAPRTDGRPETCWLEQWTKLADEEGTRALGDLRTGVERALQILGEAFVSHPKNTALREALRGQHVSLSDFHGQLLRLVYRLIFLFVAEDRTLDGISLLHPRDDSDAGRLARERYATHYSTARLRDLAGKIKGSRHGDLWQQFNLLVGALSGDERFVAVRQNLSLPALGSFLWSPDSTKALNASSLNADGGVELANADFLEALRHLAYTRQGKVLRPVDYKNLGAEELGGVYETLLALTPQISGDGARFTFAEFAGNERKTSGSYYTPDSLVQCLLDSALDPVVEEALKGKSGAEAEQAILNLKVCDPAVGSGHFLVGAAHRLARHLARVRANSQGESEPSPLLYQHALRDVIGRCLYGVDINPMSAELCRVSLWLEALEPGKPLSFLDHHIQVGNSLLGTTPALLAAGIPDDAFKPIEGDVKSRCTELKRENKRERQEYKSGQGYLFDPPHKLGNLAAEFAKIDAAGDDTPDAVQEKERRYAELVTGQAYQFGRLLADTWCAAFVWNKDDSDLGKLCPTERYFRRVESHAAAGLLPHVRAEVECLRNRYQFLHWHLAFPDVFRLPGKDDAPENDQTGWSGGFDVVLGNPPWEMVELSEKEFFSQSAPLIARASSARQREALIQDLATSNPVLFDFFSNVKRLSSGTRHFIQSTQRFPLGSTGRINLYPLFVENSLTILRAVGRAGMIVPSAISMDAYNAPLFGAAVAQRRLASLYDFENSHAIFDAVHRSYRFCLLTLLGSALQPQEIQFCYFAHSIEEIADSERRVRLSSDDIKVFSPNTLAPPMLLNAADARLATTVYRRFGVFFDHAKDPIKTWSASIQRMLSLSDPGDLFRRAEELESERGSWSRLYCGKAIHQYDHRFASFANGDWQPSGKWLRDDPNSMIATEYYARSDAVRNRLETKEPNNWLLSYRDVCRATDERTAIAAVIPATACDTTCRNIYVKASRNAIACLLGNLNSFVFDYFVRQKVIGIHLGAGVFEQLPVLPPDTYSQACPWVGAESRGATGSSLSAWLLPRVLELTYTAWDLEPFARDCRYDGPPFRWDEERRFLLRAELDAAFFYLYLPADPHGHWLPAPTETPEDLARLKASFPTPRDAVSYIMDTFPIVRRKDEEKHNGDYRTKRVILEIYDAMQESIHAGQPYQTRLNPPPGPPAAWEIASQVVATSNVESGSDSAPARWIASEWLPGTPRSANWPSHIHPPRDVREERAPAAPRIVVPTEELDLDRLLAAFREVRGGMSADFVVADPETNRRLQEAARDLGLRADPTRLNQALLNARKAGKLKEEPSDRAYRLNRQYEPYVFASEWAVRHLQRQLIVELDRLPALDELLCNPEWAARFDEIVARIKPGFAPIDYRWAALSFRKRGRNKPDDAALDLPLDRQLTLGDWAKPLAPTGPGLYLICSDDRPAYVNWASNLNDQIARHKEVAGDELVPPWLIDGFGRASRIEYAEFRHRPPKQLQEMRIMQVAKLKPWLNLLDFGDAA